MYVGHTLRSLVLSAVMVGPMYMEYLSIATNLVLSIVCWYGSGPGDAVGCIEQSFIHLQ